MISNRFSFFLSRTSTGFFVCTQFISRSDLDGRAQNVTHLFDFNNNSNSSIRLLAFHTPVSSIHTRWYDNNSYLVFSLLPLLFYFRRMIEHIYEIYWMRWLVAKYFRHTNVKRNCARVKNVAIKTFGSRLIVMYNLHVECGYALFVISLMELEMMIYYSLFTSHRNNLFVLVLLVGLLFAKKLRHFVWYPN